MNIRKSVAITAFWALIGALISIEATAAAPVSRINANECQQLYAGYYTNSNFANLGVSGVSGSGVYLVACPLSMNEIIKAKGTYSSLETFVYFRAKAGSYVSCTVWRTNIYGGHVRTASRSMIPYNEGYKVLILPRLSLANGGDVLTLVCYFRDGGSMRTYAWR